MQKFDKSKRHQYLRFYVTHHQADLGLEEDFAGTLYVANILTQQVRWFDNLNYEWVGSTYKYNDIKDDPEFVEITHNWDNGYITKEDAEYTHTHEMQSM